MNNSTKSTASKKPYERPKVEPVALEYEGSICTASIADTATVKSTTRQEVNEIDFSKSGFTFEWE